MAYSNFLKKKIISSSKNKSGLILYNTKTNSNKEKFDKIEIVHDLNYISSKHIKDCDDLILNMIEKYPPSEEEANFYEVLWTCNNSFMNKDDLKNTF